MAKQVYDLQAGNYYPTRMHLNFEVTTGLLDKLGICIDEKALSDLEGEKVFLNFM